MNDSLHYTDTLSPFKDVICGKQIQHWVEFQLVDELGQPLASLPYRAANEASRGGYVPEFAGYTDAEGVIRLEGLHPLPITLWVGADLLAEQLQTRRLRAVRAEPRRPGVGDRTPLYGPQRAGFSPVEKAALAKGHDYQYLRIGQLCDRRPIFQPPLADPSQLPAFHFPDETFSGFTVSGNQLDRRHVLEVCPFRAWSLVLHHQEGYSLVNAYNLGLMSILAYSNRGEGDLGSVKELFERQCLDLSRTPRVWDSGQAWPCVVEDVPFRDRYLEVEPLDTAKAVPPEGHTQLFYAVSASQVLVAWRGTEMEGLADLITDATFRPVRPEISALCEPKVPCPDLTSLGSVHLGFRDAFEVARRIYTVELGKTILEGIGKKKLFICGHSLGGALGLIHAASLLKHNPLLYTYGMPRTFTLLAVQYLGDLWHFRHVNDTDLIPRVPPEADLDNDLYNAFGPIGTALGFGRSLQKAAQGMVIKHENAFSHHGKIAMFFRAEQHHYQEIVAYPAYRRPDGAPIRGTITAALPEKAKLYLVPSLSETDEHEAEEATQLFNASLSPEYRARYFPHYSNTPVGRMLRIGDHFMSQYQPYIHNQLLESINPAREPLLERQIQRRKFEQQIKDYYGRVPEEELARNRVFLDLQRLVDKALRVTKQADGGNEALERFDAIADPRAYYEKTYG